MTLTEYLLEVRRLLRDANAAYWSDAALTASINRAMKQRDRDTGENRLVQPVTLTAGTGVYGVTAAPFNTRTIDVLGIVVLWGNFRYQLSQVGYTELGSQFQPYQNFQAQPVAFARRGAGTIVLAPVPNQAYASEWDTLVVATDLALGADADPLPYPWTDPVPFLAAHFARLELQQYDEAEKYLMLYNDRLTYVMGGARGGMSPNPYSNPSVWGTR